MRGLIVLVALVVTARAAMILTSPDFKNYGMIPGDYGCDPITGEERDPFKPSPPLAWFRPPEKTRSFVLLVDDMDNSGFVHWLVANIPMNTSQIDADASGVAMPEGSTEYPNTYGGLGWGGPCPLGERHRYRFRLFALNIPEIEIHVPMQNLTSLNAADVQAQLDPYTIYVAVLAGDYQCPIYPSPSAIPSPPVVPSQYNPPPPIEIRRYFKPSESFRKKQKIQGIYDSAKHNCTDGSEAAQTVKYFDGDKSPDALVAGYFPLPKLWIGDPRTTSTDPGSDLSTAEKARRRVRIGGTQPINVLDDYAITVPVAYPEVPPVFNFGDWSASDMTESPSGSPDGSPVIPTQMSGAPTANPPGVQPTGDCQHNNLNETPLATGEQMLLQGDFTVLNEDANTTATIAARQITEGLREKLVEAGCDDCNNGFVRPDRRKYSLSVRTTEFSRFIPPLHACDPQQPSSGAPSIPLGWRLAPSNTKSLVLMMDDVTDADNQDESQTFGLVNWLVVNIPPTAVSLYIGASGTLAMPAGSMELRNSFGIIGYSPPCPSDTAEHRYRIRIYALPNETTELQLNTMYFSKQVDRQLRPIVTAAMELSYTVPAALSLPAAAQVLPVAERPREAVRAEQPFVRPAAPTFFPQDLAADLMNGHGQ